MHERQIIINDHLINYYTLEPAGRSSATVLFLHGWRSDGAVWLPAMQRLADLNFSSCSIDLPGFGKSEAPKSPWRVSDYADAVRSLIERTGSRSVVLIGHSFGGRVAIQLAATSPDRVRKLILVDSAGIRTEPRGKILKRIAAKILKPIFSPGFMRPLRKKIYTLIGSEDYIATPALTETFLNIVNEDLRPNLPLIKTETLLIWGDRDAETPLETGELMQRLIPDSKLLVLPGAGHFSFLDQPEEFLNALTDFLAKKTP